MNSLVGANGAALTSFKAGDLVRLKSGGPPMTVVAVKPTPAGFSVLQVAWINSQDTGQFMEVTDAAVVKTLE